MTARLPSGLLVSALIRRVQDNGGHATVLAKGDQGGGAILLICAERGQVSHLLERVIDLDGGYVWSRCGPKDCGDPGEVTQYLEKRRASDPDLWLVELDIADAERFAAETIASH